MADMTPTEICEALVGFDNQVRLGVEEGSIHATMRHIGRRLVQQATWNHFLRSWNQQEERLAPNFVAWQQAALREFDRSAPISQPGVHSTGVPIRPAAPTPAAVPARVAAPNKTKAKAEAIHVRHPPLAPVEPVRSFQMIEDEGDEDYEHQSSASFSEAEDRQPARSNSGYKRRIPMRAGGYHEPACRRCAKAECWCLKEVGNGACFPCVKSKYKCEYSKFGEFRTGSDSKEAGKASKGKGKKKAKPKSKQPSKTTTRWLDVSDSEPAGKLKRQTRQKSRPNTSVAAAARNQDAAFRRLQEHVDALTAKTDRNVEIHQHLLDRNDAIYQRLMVHITSIKNQLDAMESTLEEVLERVRALEEKEAKTSTVDSDEDHPMVMAGQPAPATYSRGIPVDSGRFRWNSRPNLEKRLLSVSIWSAGSYGHGDGKLEAPEMYLDEIQDWVAIAHELSISKASIHVLMRDVGITYKLLRKAASEWDEVAREEFWEFARDNLIASMIITVDESSKDGRTIFQKRGHAPKGHCAIIDADFV
ncbi:hypothetical protein BYT27DRAFT_7209331 [Phlegmacium glaucopus]|nr:hypothetical protein BYT27DRAFT_7209331 [Phlegmacium glaucopus]